MSGFRLSAAAMIVVAAGAAAASPDGAADYIIRNASIETIGPQGVVHSLAVRNGTIVAIGPEADRPALVGPDTKVLDLNGRTVIPGLQDSHIHPISLGRDVQLTADLSNARSAADIIGSLQALKQRVGVKPGQWVTGSRWDPSLFKVLFTRWDIDKVTPDNPVALNRYRGIAVNTRAFKAMGISDADPSTWPAWWLKDPAGFTTEDTVVRAPRSVLLNGRTQTVMVPTGLFIGTEASKLVTARPPSPTFEEDVESMRLGSIELLKVGVTSIVDAANGFGYDDKVYSALIRRGQLGIKVANSYQGAIGRQSLAEVQRIFGGQVSGLGDAHHRLMGAKFAADYGPSARGSWVSKAYVPAGRLDKPDFGVAIMPLDADREAQYRAALDNGFDLHTHATGDAAIAQTVRLYKKLLDDVHARRPREDLRWSIEHANLPLEIPGVIEDMARYKIFASVQPAMIPELGNAWSINIGPERMARSLPVASYIRHGVLVASGSDYGVVTYDPWMGMYGLVARKDKISGQVYGPAERVTVLDALRTYTINGAIATYDEATRGTLEPGKAADFVVLDIPSLQQLTDDPERLRTMGDKVVATFVDGVLRYQKPGTSIGVGQR